MLADSTGTVLYYGKIHSDTVTNTVTQSSVTIPTGLAVGYYKLYVFAEQVNTGNQLTITRGQKYLLGVEVPYYGPLKLAEMFNAAGTKLGN